MSDERETRCTFETLGAPLRCRYSGGHPGPHIFIWIPGTPRASEVDAVRSDMDTAVNLLNAEVARLRVENSELHTLIDEHWSPEVKRLRTAIEELRAWAAEGSWDTTGAVEEWASRALKEGGKKAEVERLRAEIHEARVLLAPQVQLAKESHAVRADERLREALKEGGK
jgi:hypothetical protein